MSVNNSINNILMALPDPSIRFLELLIQKNNQNYFEERNQNNGRITKNRNEANLLSVTIPSNDRDITSLTIIPEQFNQNPYSSIIYLLDNLYDFDVNKKIAI